MLITILTLSVGSILLANGYCFISEMLHEEPEHVALAPRRRRNRPSC